MEQEVIAEAFKDDDLIADFAMDKAATEEAEKPKDIDLTLQGWGSWTGPGIEHNKKNDRLVIPFVLTFFNTFSKFFQKYLEYSSKFFTDS